MPSLVTKWKRASGTGCLTEERPGSKKGGTSNKRRAKNQERDDKMCKSHDGSCLGNMLASLMFAGGSWSRTAIQNHSPDRAARVGLHPQLGNQVGRGRYFNWPRRGQTWTDRASWYHHISAHFSPDSISSYPQLCNKIYYVVKIDTFY